MSGQEMNIWCLIFLDMSNINLHLIFAFHPKDILAKLEEKSENVLRSLKEKLMTEIGKKFPDYANKETYKRRVKKTLCNDIVYLGECLVLGQIIDKLDKVYKNSAGQAENRQPLNQNSDLKHVIQEINVMKDAQNELLEEITFL